MNNVTKTAQSLVGDINRMRRETDMMMATVTSLSQEELAAPSKCDGWTRAHVVAHLARNADGVANLIEWATSGLETSMYASREQRDADIERTAKLPREELFADLSEANERLSEAVERLKNEGITVDEVAILSGPINSLSLVARRTSELVIHHDDLATTWEWHEADPEAILDAIEVCVRRLQANPDSPGLTIVAGEGEQWVVGDGAYRIEGYYDELLPFLAREQVEEGLQFDGELPKLPPW